MQDPPAFGSENWFTFPEDDMISSEDSACAMNGYGGVQGVSEAANNSYLSPWIPSLQEEMPLPCGSDSLGFVEHSPVPDVFANVDYNHLRHPQSLPYEGVPVPVSFEGYGAFPGSDLESCSRPISCLSPSIYPMPDIAQEEMKKARINKSKVRTKTCTPKFIKPRPLSRRWGLSAELQESNGGISGRVPFSTMLRKEDIDPLVHAYTCTKSNCGIMCTQLKKLINHVKKCGLRKTPMKCSSCQWMGLLLSMHAQKCNIKCCPLPCCSHR